MKSIRYIIAIALLAIGATAYADIKQATFLVTTNAYTPTQCSILASAMTFPRYDPNQTLPSDATAAIEVACLNGRGYTIYPQLSGNAIGSQPRMASGGGFTLNYNVYTENTHTAVWDNANRLSGTGIDLFTPTIFTVYGRVPAFQASTDGSRDAIYNDVIVATVEFF